MMKFMLFSTARPSAKPHRFHNGKSRSQVTYHHDAEHKQHGARVLPDAEVGVVGNGNTGKDRHPHADHQKGQQAVSFGCHSVKIGMRYTASSPTSKV